VALLAKAWLMSARGRRRVPPRPPPREELIRRHAPGRTFADIGSMWGIDGAMSFLAEEEGALSVTGLDLMPMTPEYVEQHRIRGSNVRFVQGDLHDPEAIAAVGVHDVVWCSGVIYHAPHPLLTLARLRSITGRLLILATETIPEVPGIRGACVFLPGLPEPDRRAHAAARPGITAAGLTAPFDPDEAYGTWWWGISRSALRGMLSVSGFETLEEYGDSLHTTVLARPIPTFRGALNATGPG
jgi:hypothetical protein